MGTIHKQTVCLLRTQTISAMETSSNFKFGCGTSNDGLFGETDGLIGLGRERASLVSQVVFQVWRNVFLLPSFEI
jgi:Xylanase inhibitor N-terminal